MSVDHPPIGGAVGVNLYSRRKAVYIAQNKLTRSALRWITLSPGGPVKRVGKEE